MANPHRGAVALDLGDRSYTLSFSANAICELEDMLGEGIGTIAGALEGPSGASMRTIRALVWAGLQDYHEGTSVKEAGALISEVGMQPMVEKIGDAFRLAFPEQEASDKARPTKARGSNRLAS